MLSKYEQGDFIDQSLYNSMIGSFLYLTSSHLKITFLGGEYARYPSNHMVSHLTQVKHIIKYIIQTSDLWNFVLFCYKLLNGGIL